MVEKFRNLGIQEHILKVIGELAFEEPSEIQTKTIPLVLRGDDVIGGSATGSGKTLAFASGIIQRCDKGKGIQALVLTPTRELAEQIFQMLKVFSRYKPLNMLSVYGGVSINPQIDNLRSADVVIGTPGRILDHLMRHTINLSKIHTLVLDEADRMLDMGFIEDVEKIIQACPQNRQTMLFSATIPEDIARLARRYMRQPIKIFAEVFVDPSKLKQVYYDVPDNLKLSLLIHLIKNEKSGLVMVFCNSRDTTDFVTKNLKRSDIDATSIHGGLSQNRRSQVLGNFNTQNVSVLVCTDVAARGLDIPGVSHVYNYDIPKESKQYIHRIGRTARAGHDGIAVNILGHRDFENFDRVLRDNAVTIKKQELPALQRISVRPPERGDYDRDKRPHKIFGKGPRRQGRANTGRPSFGKGGDRGGPRGPRKDFGRGREGEEYAPPRFGSSQ